MKIICTVLFCFLLIIFCIHFCFFNVQEYTLVVNSFNEIADEVCCDNLMKNEISKLEFQYPFTIKVKKHGKIFNSVSFITSIPLETISESFSKEFNYDDFVNSDCADWFDDKCLITPEKGEVMEPLLNTESLMYNIVFYKEESLENNSIIITAYYNVDIQKGLIKISVEPRNG